jgi:hypothetical protein
MPPAGCEPIIPASERLQTHSLDRVNVLYTATLRDMPLAGHAVQRPCELTGVYCNNDVTRLYYFDVFGGCDTAHHASLHF